MTFKQINITHYDITGKIKEEPATVEVRNYDPLNDDRSLNEQINEGDISLDRLGIYWNRALKNGKRI